MPSSVSYLFSLPLIIKRNEKERAEEREKKRRMKLTFKRDISLGSYFSFIISLDAPRLSLFQS